MAPGLGLMEGMIIDRRFAQRGWTGRTLGVVAHTMSYKKLLKGRTYADSVDDNHTRHLAF
jgi:cyanophycinase-like exopeptidase